MSRQHRKRRQQVEKKNARKREARAAGPASTAGPYAGRHVPLERIDECRWRVPKTGAMNVDGIIYAREDLLPDLREDKCLEQVANVATLPGIVGHSFAMPDIHWGYGFPIGGVAGFDPGNHGIVSPGGVGYDINCGVRMLCADLSFADIKPHVKNLTQKLFEAIPSGVGSSRPELALDEGRLSQVLARGLGWAREEGFATDDDVAHVEEHGCIPGADPGAVSRRARSRGRDQLGTLGSGNHFAEIGYVDEVYDETTAQAYGLRRGQVTLMIHSGSRGLGHQVCEDSLGAMLAASATYGIPLVDRQLCCAPIDSPEAKTYLGAMAAAANFAFCNRQVMAHWARDVFKRELGAKLRTLYDVCHNIAKFEEHPVDGGMKRLLVHRKGATRALPPGHPLVPEAYRALGQPVIIPGDMGRYSFVLRGGARSEDTFGSACHGAGRLLSRSEAKRRHGHENVVKRLEEEGIFVIGASRATVVEEVPQAYKDVAQVVDVVHHGGLAEKVARIRPVGVVKG